jgi:hypothetical protein
MHNESADIRPWISSMVPNDSQHPPAAHQRGSSQAAADRTDTTAFPRIGDHQVADQPSMSNGYEKKGALRCQPIQLFGGNPAR